MLVLKKKKRVSSYISGQLTLVSRLRRPGLAVLALGFFGLGYGFNHMKTTMRNNELAQKEQRNFYVSVDRSGGGI